MPTLTAADGRTLAYRIVGEGPILVCHPGGPGFPARYFGDLAGLAGRRTLVLLDPRGAGGSTLPDPPSYLLEDYAADLEDLRVGLGLDRMSVLGHSHGGFVAIAWAARHPGSVERLLLVGTAARFSPEVRESHERGMAAYTEEPWYEAARTARETRQRFEFENDEELARLYADEFRFQVRPADGRVEAAIARITAEPPNGAALRFFNTTVAPTFDVRSELARITAPTRVVCGELDFMTPGSREVASGIAGAELVLIPECAHFPWIDQPERFRAAVDDFLAA